MTSYRSHSAVWTLPNILTMFRIVLVPVYLWLFAQETVTGSVGALLVYIIASVTDLYDGKLARSRKEVTTLGKFLDPLADKFLVIGALLQFSFMGLVNLWFVGVIVVRDVWVTVMRIHAMSTNKELRTSTDAKVKTTIQISVIIAIIVFWGARAALVQAGVTGAAIDISLYRLFFNVIVGVAVIFTLYSWGKYMITGYRAKHTSSSKH